MIVFIFSLLILMSFNVASVITPQLQTIEAETAYICNRKNSRRYHKGRTCQGSQNGECVLKKRDSDQSRTV